MSLIQIYLKAFHVVALSHLLRKKLEPVLGRVLRTLFHRVRQSGQLVQGLDLLVQLDQVRPEPAAEGLEQEPEPDGQRLRLELRAEVPEEEVADLPVEEGPPEQELRKRAARRKRKLISIQSA